MKCAICKRFSSVFPCHICQMTASLQCNYVYTPEQHSSLACLYSIFGQQFNIPDIRQRQAIGFDENAWLASRGGFLVNIRVPQDAPLVRTVRGYKLHQVLHLIFDVQDSSYTTSIGFGGHVLYQPNDSKKRPSVREIGLFAKRITRIREQRQTRFVKVHGGGNCLTTCIANLLGCDIPDFPLVEIAAKGNRHKTQVKAYFRALDTWLLNKGYVYIEIKLADANAELPQCFDTCGYHIIGGKSPRGVQHAIIGRYGEPYFDPHPSDDMVTPDGTYGFLIATDIRNQVH